MKSAATSPRASSPLSVARSVSLPCRWKDGRASSSVVSYAPGELVHEVAERLNARILAARDDEAPAARVPHPLGDLVERRLERRRREAVRRERGSSAARDPDGQVRQQMSGFAGRNADAPIGVRAGQRQPRFDLHVIRHGRRVAVDLAARRVAARELDRRDPRAEEIGVEADDDVGAIEAVARERADAVRRQVGVEHGGHRNGVVRHVTRVLESRQKLPDERHRRRTGLGVGEEPDAAALLLDPIQRRDDLCIDGRPRWTAARGASDASAEGRRTARGSTPGRSRRSPRRRAGDPGCLQS